MGRSRDRAVQGVLQTSPAGEFSGAAEDKRSCSEPAAVETLRCFSHSKRSRASRLASKQDSDDNLFMQLMDDESPIEPFIDGSEKLLRIFGYWPSFHDAEVIDLHLWRGDVDPDRARYVFPVLTLKFHLWELTSEVDSKGYLILGHHTLTTLRFHHVDRIEMNGFNHQNQIVGLSIMRRGRADGPSPFFAVQLEPGFGISASFECLSLEVVDATPCTGDGHPVSDDEMRS